MVASLDVGKIGIASREKQLHLIILPAYIHYVTIIKLCHPLSNGPQSPHIFVEEI